MVVAAAKTDSAMGIIPARTPNRPYKRTIEMSYIDGFVIPVLAGNKEADRKIAVEAAAIFMEYGAS